MKLKVFILVTVLPLLLLAGCRGNAEVTDPSPEAGGGSHAGEVPVTEPEAEESGETSAENGGAEAEPQTKLLYQGHASLRLTSRDGTVVYVDPYAWKDPYELPADIVLITHQHTDHNNIRLVTQKQDCVVITNAEALEGGTHNTFSVKGIDIEAVGASNKNHSPKNCVGYIITIDGIKLYMAGDTSKTEQMETFAEREFDYALLPCDGVYNMDAKEAAECAEIIGAKHNIPIHTNPAELFDREIAESFDAPNRLILEAGEEIELIK